MRDNILAKRYADAFVSYASPKIGLPAVFEDMKRLRWLLRENADLNEFLLAPDVPYSEKSSVIDKVLADGFSDETRDFLKYLIDKGRVDRIVQIADYIRVVYSHGDVLDAVLHSTFPLELDDVQAIKDSLERRIKRKVNLYLELDPDLLGGVKISVGNRVLDGTIRNKLVELRKQLMKMQVER
jgi:F-type H+-transporting ATPase subunit delta